MSSVWEQISEKARLVSLPDVYLRLKTVLDDPDYCLADVSDVVGADPAMTTHLLRLVNSAYFGLGTKIDTVKHAVSMLGTQEVHDLVLATSVAQSFDGVSNSVMDMQRFWKRSIMTAIVSRELAAMCNILDSERLFVAGLLRDIGHLFIYQAVPHMALQSIELAKAKEAPLFKAERAVMGVDYAHVGAEMMRRWQLPQSLWEPTECHVEPGKADEFALATSLIHVAGVVAENLEEGGTVQDALAKVSSRAWQTTGLGADQCTRLPEKVDAEYGTVLQLIRPVSNAA